MKVEPTTKEIIDLVTVWLNGHQPQIKAAVTSELERQVAAAERAALREAAKCAAKVRGAESTVALARNHL